MILIGSKQKKGENMAEKNQKVYQEIEREDRQKVKKEIQRAQDDCIEQEKFMKQLEAMLRQK